MLYLFFHLTVKVHQYHAHFIYFQKIDTGIVI